MNSRLTIALVLAAAFLFAVGCVSSGYDPLVAAVKSVVSDGQVTSAEVEFLKSQMPKPGLDWGSVAMSAATIAASLLGVKILPTRVLQGPFDPKQPSQVS